ncbi:MAG: HAD family hydrolase [Clostridia bacterium]|nr:HAD family hydrolase [Clostridia bacterium]
MKTLYLSDLDGTLLRNDETISDFTAKTINELTEKGICFSFATARSLVTTKKVTANIQSRLPVIVYNGAFIMDSISSEILYGNFFEDKSRELLEDINKSEVFPVVYSFIDGNEKLSFVEGKSTDGQKLYLKSRKGDKRINPVKSFEDLLKGDKFYITCIDEAEKLKPVYEKYSGIYKCLYQKDYYSDYYWLEIMPKNATKANAALKLKEMLGCDELVAFGDEINDIELFKIADKAVAVANAKPELIPFATDFTDSNENDGVAKFIKKTVAEV